MNRLSIDNTMHFYADCELNDAMDYNLWDALCSKIKFLRRYLEIAQL